MLARRCNRDVDGRALHRCSRSLGMTPPDDAPGALLAAPRRLCGRRPAAGDPLWYKDAIIYQLHVKAFFDANNDGIGDFEGLSRKLDYLQDLGVTALWLLPFYPSPLRDDGYDIADYKSIHPAYGRMADFKAFVREAHRREPAGHHRAGDQPHLRPAPVVPARAARASRARRGATSTCGATPTRNFSRPASSFSTPRSRTGPGTRWRRPITGTASMRTSPTSISTIRGCSARSSTSMQLLARPRGRRPAARRRALPDRARGHQQREPAGNARRPAPAARRARPAATTTACCSPRPTSGRRTCCNISARATNATWRSTSR